jgi:fumarate reductase subunit D
MQKSENSKTGVVIAIVAVVLLLGGYLLIKVILPLGAIKGEELDEGHIRLPNNYQILMISAVNRYLLHGDQSAVEHDVDALAWNTRYVFYHLSNQKDLQSKMPDKERFGILDTETGKIDTYKTLKEAQQALNKLGTDSLELKSVMDFFPETKGSAPHKFTLE